MNITDQRIGFLIQARMGSTRLPGKVLMDLQGKPLLTHILDRVNELNTKSPVAVITTNTKKDDIVEDYCRQNSVLIYRGDEADVLDRYFQAAKDFHLDQIIRLTGDNPLVDPSNLKKLIEMHLKGNADYSSNKSEVGSGLPEGVGAEIFRFSALERSWREGKKPNHREHVNEYILENPSHFKVQLFKGVADIPESCEKLRLTVDTPDDFRYVQNVFSLLEQNHMRISLDNICTLKLRGLIR